mgnify:CR=1 FL=1
MIHPQAVDNAQNCLPSGGVKSFVAQTLFMFDNSLGGHASYGMCVLASLASHVIIIATYLFWDRFGSEE